MKKFTTNRGFQGVQFEDSYGFPCKLLQSSAIAEDREEAFENPGSSYVLLGFDRSRFEDGMPIDPAVMHLSRDRVKELISCLQNWLDFNDFEGEND